MGNNEEFFIPSRLDEPLKIFIFPVDEVVAVASFFVWGVVSDYKFVGLVLGLIAVSLVRKIKRSEGGRVLRNALYWYLPSGIGGGRSLPPSYVRKWKG